jgi:hypothetical protein
MHLWEIRLGSWEFRGTFIGDILEMYSSDTAGHNILGAFLLVFIGMNYKML